MLSTEMRQQELFENLINKSVANPLMPSLKRASRLLIL
jgi:hypothetical protein